MLKLVVLTLAVCAVSSYPANTFRLRYRQDRLAESRDAWPERAAYRAATSFADSAEDDKSVESSEVAVKPALPAYAADDTFNELVPLGVMEPVPQAAQPEELVAVLLPGPGQLSDQPAELVIHDAPKPAEEQPIVVLVDEPVLVPAATVPIAEDVLEVVVPEQPIAAEEQFDVKVETPAEESTAAEAQPAAAADPVEKAEPELVVVVAEPLPEADAPQVVAVEEISEAQQQSSDLVSPVEVQPIEEQPAVDDAQPAPVESSLPAEAAPAAEPLPELSGSDPSAVTEVSEVQQQQDAEAEQPAEIQPEAAVFVSDEKAEPEQSVVAAEPLPQSAVPEVKSAAEQPVPVEVKLDAAEGVLSETESPAVEQLLRDEPSTFQADEAPVPVQEESATEAQNDAEDTTVPSEDPSLSSRNAAEVPVVELQVDTTDAPASQDMLQYHKEAELLETATDVAVQDGESFEGSADSISRSNEPVAVVEDTTSPDQLVNDPAPADEGSATEVAFRSASLDLEAVPVTDSSADESVTTELP